MNKWRQSQHKDVQNRKTEVKGNKKEDTGREIKGWECKIKEKKNSLELQKNVLK